MTREEQKHIDYISRIRKELLSIENNAKDIDGLTESQWVVIRAAHRLLGEYIEKEQESINLHDKIEELCSKYPINKYSMSNEELSSYHQGVHLGATKIAEYLNEQKSVEWSEEDEDMRDTIIRDLKHLGGDMVNVSLAYKEEIDWLKALRLQPHSEWRHYIWATNLRFDFTALIKYDNTDNYEIVQAGNRPKQEKNGVYILIKDIKPQPSWKPSEEQMEAFKKYIEESQARAEAAVGGWNNFDVMIRLYEQLKKL